jgi:hypothetical protein
MKATLVYRHKSRLQGRYILEMTIHHVGKSSQYPEGIKYGLILVDTKSDRKLLMDNHHPKGPHIHIDNEELPYTFIDETRLIKDFKVLVETYMGVAI